MKRRNFFGAAAAASALTAGAGCSGEQQKTSSVADSGGMKLAGKTLEELREEHRYWLIDDYLPFESAHVFDHEYGGFMCNTDRDGTNLTQNKRTWYEGRGIWVHSHYYNTVEKDPKHLEMAKKTVESIMKQNPTGPELMPVGYTREGKPLRNEPDPIFYGDMFVANGFQEYSLASGDEKYWDMAKQIVLKCLDIYDNRPGYGNLAPVPDKNIPGIERPRILGHWFMLLRTTTQMLEKRPDPELEAINNRAVDAIMKYHYNPAYDLINEYINHDMTHNDGDHGQSSIGHAPETLWMVMFEALRRKDRALFDLAAERFHRHIEVLWDDVYGGLLGGLSNVDRNEWTTAKYLWLQEEGLIGTMCVIEHTGAEWAKEWFSRLYTYVTDKYPLKQYGYPIWILYADRKVTFVEHTTRVGNFHHPRQLMTNMKALDRIISRGGKPSGVFGA